VYHLVLFLARELLDKALGFRLQASGVGQLALCHLLLALAFDLSLPILDAGCRY
jgi:hypothetical protein